jgi:hypothetical protein
LKKAASCTTRSTRGKRPTPEVNGKNGSLNKATMVRARIEATLFPISLSRYRRHPTEEQPEPLALMVSAFVSAKRRFGQGIEAAGMEPKKRPHIAISIRETTQTGRILVDNGCKSP